MKTPFPAPPPTQPYIGSPIAGKDAGTELASYAAFSNDIDLLVDPATEVLTAALVLVSGVLTLGTVFWDMVARDACCDRFGPSTTRRREVVLVNRPIIPGAFPLRYVALCALDGISLVPGRFHIRNGHSGGRPRVADIGGRAPLRSSSDGRTVHRAEEGTAARRHTLPTVLSLRYPSTCTSTVRDTFGYYHGLWYHAVACRPCYVPQLLMYRPPYNSILRCCSCLDSNISWRLHFSSGCEVPVGAVHS